MRKSKLEHPWRGLRAREDAIAGKRSHAFTVYLESLPAEERKRILDAERAYVSKVESTTSAERSTLRAYNESMLGIKEGEAVEHHGFVV